MLISFETKNITDNLEILSTNWQIGYKLFTWHIDNQKWLDEYLI